MKKYLAVPVFLAALVLCPALGRAQFAAPVRFAVPVSLGMQSPEVLKIQQFLVDHGYLHAAIGGYYGAVTAGAVIAFQEASGITATNAYRVGPLTLAALNKADAGGSTSGQGASQGSTGLSIPAARTLPAAYVTKTSAVLSGIVTPTTAANAVTSVFRYGTSLAYGLTAEAVASASGASASVAGLSCGTVYHFEISAQNAAGTSTGGDMTFATLSCGL